MVFVSPRLKFNEEKNQWSVIRKTKICLHSQPEGIDAIFVSLFMVKPCPFSLFLKHVLSLRLWELCTACSVVAMLHCLLNRQYPTSGASFSSTSCHGPFWWHHHSCHSHCGQAPLGKRLSWTAAHRYLLVLCPTKQYSLSLQCCFAAADYTWWLHLNHIQFHFLLSPLSHATLAAEHSTSGCTQVYLSICIYRQTQTHTRQHMHRFLLLRPQG